MSGSHGNPKHSSANEAAMHANDAHTLEQQDLLTHTGSIPPAENGGHAQSAAAHLHTGGTEHTKPAASLHEGAQPGALREPPMVVQRVGKQHK